MVCSRSRCSSRSSHDQSLNVAHELTALFPTPLFRAITIARDQVQNLFVRLRILHVGGAYLTAVTTGSVDGGKGCFQIVVGKLVNPGGREGTEAGTMYADRDCVIAQRRK